jgi:hypothetical protein
LFISRGGASFTVKTLKYFSIFFYTGKKKFKRKINQTEVGLSSARVLFFYRAP